MNWQTITDPNAARVLLDTTEFRLFAPFILAEYSLSQAAKIVDIPASSLRRRLDTWLKLGLLEQTRLEPRKGKAIRYYRAASSQIFVPFALSQAADLSELMWSVQNKLFKEFIWDLSANGTSLPQSGFCIHVVDGNLSIDFSSTEPPNLTLQTQTEAPLWNSWVTLHLEPEQAKQLRLELQALWGRVLLENKHPSLRTERFTLHLGLAKQSPKQS